MITISVDTGNKHIKTEHDIKINSALVESGSLIVGQSDALYFNGKYYTTSNSRIPYMRDKTVDDRFFILTLMAIAKELDARIADGSLVYSKDVYDICLLNGLPPAHMRQLSRKFKAYFRRGGEIITFIYRNKKYNIRIQKVYVFAQGYAAAIHACKDLSKYRRTVVIDIGGMTVDCLTFEQDNNGVFSIDMEHCFSFDRGMIRLFNKVSAACNSELGLSMTAAHETMIEDVLVGREHTLPKECVPVITKQADAFAAATLRQINEAVDDLRLSNVFICGGGAIPLEQGLLKAAKQYLSNYTIIKDEYANVKGYIDLYKAVTKRK